MVCYSCAYLRLDFFYSSFPYRVITLFQIFDYAYIQFPVDDLEADLEGMMGEKGSKC